MTSSVASDVAAISRLMSETDGSLVMSGDAAGYAGQYADDVLWSPRKATEKTSREGLENGIQWMFDKFTFQVDPRAE